MYVLAVSNDLVSPQQDSGSAAPAQSAFSVASMPASTNSSRPRTASRACASSAPSPRADRLKTCSATWWRKSRSGARSQNSRASSRS